MGDPKRYKYKDPKFEGFLSSLSLSWLAHCLSIDFWFYTFLPFLLVSFLIGRLIPDSPPNFFPIIFDFLRSSLLAD